MFCNSFVVVVVVVIVIVFHCMARLDMRPTCEQIRCFFPVIRMSPGCSVIF